MADVSVGFEDRKYSRHLFEYRYANAHWGIEIVASSPAEAAERMKALAWAQYKGEVVTRIPVPGSRLTKRIGATLASFYRMLLSSTDR